MRPSSRVRHLVATTLLLLAVAGCGDDDGSGRPGAAPPSTSESGTGFTVEDGITPEALLACLEESDVPAVAKDSTPMGVEVPVGGLDVGPLEGGPGPDSPQGADLWVFTDGAAAAENRALITLSDADTPSSWVAGNVVVRLFYPPADADPQVDSIRGCLPS